MKKFLIKIVVFVGGLVTINIVFFVIIWNIYLKEYSALNTDYTTYLLADSHGTSLGDYAEKYKVYNFSAPSDAYSDMLRKVQFLIKTTQVKKIIITVDDHVLSQYRESNNNLDRSVTYTKLLDYSTILEYIREKYINYYFVLINPKSKSVLRSFFKSFLKEKKQNNKNWSVLSQTEKKELSQNRMDTQFPNSLKSICLTNDLQKIIYLCEKNNVELVGIKYPLSGVYLSVIGNKSYGADSILMRKGVKVVDYKSKWISEDFYFENQDHLNRYGGERFVEILAKDGLFN